MNRHPQPACVDCHFFEITRLVAGHARIAGVVGEADRDLARKNKFEEWAPVDDDATANILGCHLGVWQETFSPNRPKEGRYDEVVVKNRNDCFFWPYRPHMGLEAAKTLEKREYDAREAARDRRETIRGLRLATFGLIITAVVGFGRILAAIWAAIRTTPAVPVTEKPPGSAQKAPPIPASPVAPTPSPVDPRATSAAARSK